MAVSEGQLGRYQGAQHWRGKQCRQNYKLELKLLASMDRSHLANSLVYEGGTLRPKDLHAIRPERTWQGTIGTGGDALHWWYCKHVFA